MTIRYAIHLFPKFSNIEIINMWRQEYDPLYKCIPAHITLCFPFESSLSLAVLKKHIQQVLRSTSKFSIRLEGYSKFQQKYLFLNVKDGYDRIIECHQKLHSGVLAPYLITDFSYNPHLTIGRFENPVLLDRAFEVVSRRHWIFDTVVEDVVLERIESDESCNVEFIHKFC